MSEKKAKSQQLKKISNKKDRQLFEMQERVDSADERENALKMRLLDEIQQSNMKGKLLLEMKHQIIELKKYFVQEQMYEMVLEFRKVAFNKRFIQD